MIPYNPSRVKSCPKRPGATHFEKCVAPFLSRFLRSFVVQYHPPFDEAPPEIARRVAGRGLHFHGGLHALEHAAIGILPLFAMCDRMDIGGLSTPSHPDTGRAQIFIYDAFPGGVGIAEKGFEILGELWRATLSAIEECLCEAGCPSCVQSPKCGNNNEPLDKEAAVVILRGLLK